MQIPGLLLAVPITLVAVARKSDGPTDGPTKDTRAHLVTREVVVQTATGATVTTVTKARVRPSVQVDGRSPRAGDGILIDGDRSTVESVEKVYGPGRSVAYLELTTGDG